MRKENSKKVFGCALLAVFATAAIGFGAAWAKHRVFTKQNPDGSYTVSSGVRAALTTKGGDKENYLQVQVRKIGETPVDCFCKVSGTGEDISYKPHDPVFLEETIEEGVVRRTLVNKDGVSQRLLVQKTDEKGHKVFISLQTDWDREKNTSAVMFSSTHEGTEAERASAMTDGALDSLDQVGDMAEEICVNAAIAYNEAVRRDHSKWGLKLKAFLGLK